MSVGTTISPIHGLKFLQGDPVTIGTSTSPPLILVDIWATWCPPCRATMPHLTQLQHKYPQLTVVGITNERDEAALRKFIKNNASKMQYSVAMDTVEGAYGELMTPSGATGIPTVFLILNGKVVFTGHPMDGQLEASIVQSIAALNKPKQVKLTRHELEGMSIKQLKHILEEHRAGYEGCVEKQDLVDRIMTHCTW
jgi:thiol-disulfide isomerase/thioredoxin